MLEIHSENDVIRAQKISTVFQRMVRSFTMFYYSYRDFDKIAALLSLIHISEPTRPY